MTWVRVFACRCIYIHLYECNAHTHTRKKLACSWASVCEEDRENEYVQQLQSRAQSTSFCRPFPPCGGCAGNSLHCGYVAHISTAQLRERGAQDIASSADHVKLTKRKHRIQKRRHTKHKPGGILIPAARSFPPSPLLATSDSGPRTLRATCVWLVMRAATFNRTGRGEM